MTNVCGAFKTHHTGGEIEQKPGMFRILEILTTEVGGRLQLRTLFAQEISIVWRGKKMPGTRGDSRQWWRVF
jgi:hypothetical protein